MMRHHVRRLHARFVKRTTAILVPEARPYAAPAKGLLITSALPSLWELGGAQTNTAPPPVASLVRCLWHRHEPQEPLRRTQNRSIPGCHLADSASLQGHCLELALVGVDTDEVVHELRSLGVNRLAKETGVSLARFARLITLVRDGLRLAFGHTFGQLIHVTPAPSAPCPPHQAHCFLLGSAPSA